MKMLFVSLCIVFIFVTTACAADSLGTTQIDTLSRDTTLAGLPLNIITADSANGDYMAVFLSGDGGWSSFDNAISHRLASSGVPVVGWNSLKYFWSKRTPDGAAQDLASILRRYLAIWQKKRVLLAGYSFGADVMPFLVNRLPDDLRAATGCVALISPSHNADFEFHVATWLGKSRNKSSLPVVPEVLKLKGQHALIFYGSDEDDTITADLPADVAKIILLKGGHRMSRDYDGIVSRILSEIRP
jgi:type IV secretory pathway VirJ component